MHACVMEDVFSAVDTGEIVTYIYIYQPDEVDVETAAFHKGQPIRSIERG